MLLVESGQAQLTMVLPSVAHRWYVLSSEIELYLASPFPLWYSAPYHYEATEAGACTGRQEYVCCREGPSRWYMIVAGPKVELRKGEFFLKSCNLSLCSWLENQQQGAPGWPQREPAAPGMQWQSCRWRDLELSNPCEDVAGPPSNKGWAAEGPCGGKKSGKGEAELLQRFFRGWLAINETFLIVGLVLWPWGAVSFPPTQGKRMLTAAADVNRGSLA